MRKTLAILMITSALCAPVMAAEPAAAGSTADTEKALAELRSDLQAKRADLMAKNLSLTAQEAAKFWPMFEKYQAEQNKIIDVQLDGIRKYADSYQTLGDKDALAFIDVQLDRDDAMHALRVKWLGKFRTILDDKTAARVIQIDRRLGQISQVMLSAQLPLVR